MEETGRAVAEIRMDLGLLGEVQQSLDARREEELRITRTQDGLRKQLEVLDGARRGSGGDAGVAGGWSATGSPTFGGVPGRVCRAP